MKIKMILLAFGALFFIGLAVLVTETLWADGPAGPIEAEGIYDVVLPGILPDRELSTDEVKMLVMLGVLRPEGATQLGLVEGTSCHEIVTWCGGNNWCRYCKSGRGIVSCACPKSGSPSVR